MEENKFWMGIWSLVAVVICALMASIVTVTVNSDKIVKEMVDKGTNPLDAKCAMSAAESKACLLRFAYK